MRGREEVPWSLGSRVPMCQGPQVVFGFIEQELDFKECPSCFICFYLVKKSHRNKILLYKFRLCRFQIIMKTTKYFTYIIIIFMLPNMYENSVHPVYETIKQQALILQENEILYIETLRCSRQNPVQIMNTRWCRNFQKYIICSLIIFFDTYHGIEFSKSNNFTVIPVFVSNKSSNEVFQQ